MCPPLLVPTGLPSAALDRDEPQLPTAPWQQSSNTEGSCAQGLMGVGVPAIPQLTSFQAKECGKPESPRLCKTPNASSSLHKAPFFRGVQPWAPWEKWESGRKMEKRPLYSCQCQQAPHPRSHMCTRVGSKAHTFQLAFSVHLYTEPQPGSLGLKQQETGGAERQRTLDKSRPEKRRPPKSIETTGDGRGVQRSSRGRKLFVRGASK